MTGVVPGLRLRAGLSCTGMDEGVATGSGDLHTVSCEGLLTGGGAGGEEKLELRGVVRVTVSKCWWTSSGTGSCRASNNAQRSSATISRQMGDLGRREGGIGHGIHIGCGCY